jgi:hypothetical protein
LAGTGGGLLALMAMEVANDYIQARDIGQNGMGMCSLGCRLRGHMTYCALRRAVTDLAGSARGDRREDIRPRDLRSGDCMRVRARRCIGGN